MITPKNRLILVFALMILPAVIVAVLLPDFQFFAAVFIVLTLIVFLIDIGIVLGSLDNIKIKLPEVIRFTKNKQASFEIQLNCGNSKVDKLYIGAIFPKEIICESEVYIIRFDELEERSIELLCFCTRRGLFSINEVLVGRDSVLGFWLYKKKFLFNSEIRVYPNLIKENRRLAALFSKDSSSGMHLYRQLGKGREFEKLREYIPGDTYEDIHWKATARHRVPISKVYRLERTQKVYVVLDNSRLSARKSKIGNSNIDLERFSDIDITENQLERFITAALIMGLTAEKQGDSFGLITHSDSVQTFIKAHSGKHHFNTCRDALYQIKPQKVNPGYDELFSFIKLRIRQRALLIFLTNLDDPLTCEQFKKGIESISKQHLVITNMLKPDQAKPIFTDQLNNFDEIFDAIGQHNLWHQLKELERQLHYSGVKFNLLEDEKLCTEIVTQYLNIKQRQLL